MFALFDIAVINVVVIELLSPIKDAISCSVSRTAGAVPIRSENLVLTCSVVYALIPLTVILFSSDVKLIPVPGTIF